MQEEAWLNLSRRDRPVPVSRYNVSPYRHCQPPLDPLLQEARYRPDPSYANTFQGNRLSVGSVLANIPLLVGFFFEWMSSASVEHLWKGCPCRTG